MELYQIRYFLAVSRTLNFTRAAEECNVSQPALTRAVQKLEQELGGTLFRREGRRTHLTDLGRAMMPPLQQSLEAAEQAKQQAESYGRGDVAPLRIGLSESVPLQVFLPVIRELSRAQPGIRLELTRGEATVLMTQLEEGDLELVIAAADGSTWSRFDGWRLYDEDMTLCAEAGGPLSGRVAIQAQDLAGLDIVARRHCETTAALAERLEEIGVELTALHSADRESDFNDLVASGLGVGLAPRSNASLANSDVIAVPVADLDISRTVSLFAVAGRRYSPAAAGLIRLARSADWEHAAGPVRTMD